MSAEQTPGGMLTSWKEIAGFFGRDVRTVQRWEKDEGLPVHRHHHHRQSSVYAYSDELAAWWREREAVVGHTPVDEGQEPSLGGDHPAGSNRARLLRMAGAVAAIAALVWFGIAVAIPSRHETARTPHVWGTLDGTKAHGELSSAPIGDLNGDGRNDLVIASRGTREAHVLFGGAIPKAGQLASSAAVTIRGTENGDYQVLTVADVNGDGIGDLLVNLLLNEPDTFRATGASSLLLGRRTWPRLLELPRDADVTFRFTRPKEIRMFACSSTNPVDLNADGIEDLVLGGPDFSPPGLASAGGVWVLFGRQAWPAAIDVERDADIAIHGSRAGEGLAPMCSAGDVNGDSRQDLAVLAYEHTLWNMLGGRGRYFVFRGRDHWPSLLSTDRDADLRVDGDRPNVASHAPVLADLNGDGFDDLLIGSTALSDQPGASRFAMFFGAAAPESAVLEMTAADVIIDGESRSAADRPAISAADLDGDAIDDVILAEAAPGRIHILQGRQRWRARGRLSQFDPVELFAGTPGLGHAWLRLGDLDGDALPEFAVSAPVESVDGTHKSGRIWLLTPHLKVDLDVRPGMEPNVLYFPGVLVAKLAGGSFAGADPIEPATVRMAGVAPTRTEWRDFDDDRTADLIMYFDTREMRLTPATTRVTLTARTRSGRLIAGHDSVTVIVGTTDQLPKGPPNH